MFAYAWPLALVVLCNVFYQICTKSVPNGMHPLASLVITYLVGAATSAVLYFLLNPGGNLLLEFTRVNWAPFVLGVIIIGLEVGYIYAYQAGWEVSVAPLVQSAFLSVALLFVGWLVYREAFTWTKVIGMVTCLAGLYILSR